MPPRTDLRFSLCSNRTVNIFICLPYLHRCIDLWRRLYSKIPFRRWITDAILEQLIELDLTLFSIRTDIYPKLWEFTDGNNTLYGKHSELIPKPLKSRNYHQLPEIPHKCRLKIRKLYWRTQHYICHKSINKHQKQPHSLYGQVTQNSLSTSALTRRLLTRFVRCILNSWSRYFQTSTLLFDL